jgi:indolepyruvate ferredoxin oxidoreductase
MTGGQDVEGGMDVPEMTRLLELEGVRRIVVTTEEPRRYRRAKLAACAEVRPRRDLDAVQRELAAVEGVTVLIHDGECAAELRRARKRGLAPQPAERVVINERVCEGCGDCGRKSGCMSVQPVETELGRKTRIHQSSCNLDRSCVDGDCPAFLTVVPAKAKGPRAVPEPPSHLPEPRLPAAAETSVRMAGIGGTGVVTISQLLGMAALLDGLHVAGLDQTGLSQKGGPVTSDLRIAREPIAGTGRVSAAGADVLLGLDLLGADNLAVCGPARTAAVVSTSAVPTQRMIVDTQERFPALSAQLDPIDRATRAGAGFALDAQALSEALFGDHMQANAIVLGAAWQRGLLPVSLAALDRAIELNGAAVKRNRAALAWGRACVADPDAVEAATSLVESTEPAAEPWAVELAERAAGGRAELRRLLEFRVADLAGFGGRRPAREYAEAVAAIRSVEEERTPGLIGVAESFARGLHRLTAYKDEYEVARLHLDAAEQARIEAELGDLASTSYHLHPPLLRALGMQRKLRLGGWFRPGLRALRAGRRLRGTPLDPFGQTALRRTERALPGEYREGVERALATLSPETHATCVEVCEAAELVRGYEDIKLAGVERFRERTAELLAG